MPFMDNKYPYMPHGSWSCLNDEPWFRDDVTEEMKERFLADRKKYEEEQMKHFEETGEYII